MQERQALPAWSQESADAFRAFALERLRAGRVPGAALGLAEAGVPLFLEGIGFRDAGRELPATADTLFGIASLTKAFTAVLILKLQEMGRLTVHDPVVRWLPGFTTPDPDHTRAITLHHLLTHSSGMPPSNLLYRAMARTLSPDDEAYHRPIDTEEELLAAIGAEDMRYVGAPGERLSYSNEGFALLGYVVEHAAGRSYGEFLQEVVLDPLFMGRTTLSVPNPADEPVTRVYRREPDGGGTTPFPVWRHAPAMLAAGFLRSTAREMLRFLEIFSRDGRGADARILSPDSMRQMLAPHRPYAPHQAYGYGVRITDGYHGLRLVEHSGGLLGVASHFTVVPERELSAVGLANFLGAPMARMALAAVNARLGLAYDEPRVVYAQPAAADQRDPRRLAGTYVSGERDVLKVVVDGSAVAIGVEAAKPARNLGAGAFVVESPGLEPQFHQFLFDAGGQVLGVTLGTRVLFRRDV